MSHARRGQAAPALSVLIPALNEAETLPLLLADLSTQRGIRIEIIVADGGSDDGTPQLARRQRARVIAAPRGRGAQLNAAVAAARAPWLLCLHADCRLTAADQLVTALNALRAAHSSSALAAGHWPLRFDRKRAGYELLFRQLEAKSASNRPGTVNGDQGLLIHAETLARLGGFDESLPFYEDQRLAAKIFALGRFVLLPGALQTSARRFETEGHSARLALMALIVGAEHAGLVDWLRALPTLYRAQHEAAPLSLAPFLHALSVHIASLPPPQQRQLWRDTGALLTANAWQLALLLDSISPASPRWLRRFDRLLATSLSKAPWPQLAGQAMAATIRLATVLSKPP